MAGPLSTVDPAKRAALQALERNGQTVICYGFVVFNWPQPIGKRVYAHAPYDDAALFPEYAAQIPVQLQPVEPRLVLEPGLFLPEYTLTGDGKDLRVNISLDNQSVVAGRDYGETIEDVYLAVSGRGAGWNVQVDFYEWWPQQDLLRQVWSGYLNPISKATAPVVEFTATWGYRTDYRDLPNAPFYRRCFNDFPPARPDLFPDLGSIAGNRCPFDRHFGGANGIDDTATCNKTLANCQLHWGNVDNLPYTGIDFVQLNNGLPFRQDSRTLDQTKGNSDVLSEPVRVMGGARRLLKQADIVGITIQTNTAHPERGSVSLTCIFSEGPVAALDSPSINDIPVDAAQYQLRLGTVRQSPTGFIPAAPTANFSSRATGTVVQKGAFAGFTASQFDVKIWVTGLSNLRIYSDPVTFVNGSSDSPSWFILEAFRDRMWGMAVDLNRLVIQDFIDLADYFATSVPSVSPEGSPVSIPRCTWSGEWRGRKIQDQLSDFFKYRFCSMPFIFEGKVRIIPLDRVELDQYVEVYTDRLDAEWRHILSDQNNISTADWSEISPDEQFTELDCRFDNAALDDMAQEPLWIQNETAEEKLGQNGGDNSVFRNKKSHFLTGVVSYPEAVRCANRLQDLGEFDSGGLVNPIRSECELGLLDAMTLHPYKVFGLDSYKLDKMFAVWGFKYFRALKIHVKGFRVAVEGVAYPESYFDEVDSAPVEIRHSPPVLPGTGPGDRPHIGTFGDPDIGPDRIRFILTY